MEKEEELKGLKSELSKIERKIQLELAPPEKAVQAVKEGTEQKQDIPVHIPAGIIPSKTIPEPSKGLKI